MADPTIITAVVGAAAGVIGAATPILFERRHKREKSQDDEVTEEKELAGTQVASWTGLNEALGREIERLHQDIDRIRTDYESAMRRQREDYEAQLNVAHVRIAELETDVASLRRLLGAPPR